MGSLELRPDLVRPYNSRGNVYLQKGEHELAIADYTEAIERNPDLAEAHYNRGLAWLQLQRCEKAKSDLTAAKGMELNIVKEFHKNYETIEDFEQKDNLKIPEAIAALLMHQ